MEGKIRPADRVFQLEARYLDHELDKIVDQTIDGLNLPRLSEELKLLVNLYLRSSHLKDAKTVGMGIYNLNYYDASEDETTLEVYKRPRRDKLIILTACNIIIPYLLNKYDKVQSLLSNGLLGDLKLSWLTLDNIHMTIKSLSVINFLAFLRNGKYLMLQDRLMGIMTGVSDQDYYTNLSINKAQMEIINRELLWKVLAEFLTTVIPYINTARIKNQLLKALGFMSKRVPDRRLSDRFGSEGPKFICAICGEKPFNAHIIGCEHIFCYYCIQSEHLLVDEYVCPVCNFNTKDESQVRRYKAYGQLREI